ncbi:MAG: squalene synthase HpnC [Betaproteobacteria bacterium]|nr:MAG: squalene synthase HpnC [Betaproteobacteria bacterium]
MGIDHYENFPVASVLLPRRLRRPVALIYAFARSADDFADEGDDPPEQRLRNLQHYQQELDLIEDNRTPGTPLFVELREVIEQYRLPVDLFRDLLSAFSQDVLKSRYADFNEVMDYCRRSANPVGRLLLHLYGASDETNLAYSDNICTSLQLINFLQDVESDYRRNRIYFPLDEMAKFGIDEHQISASDTSGNWVAFMRFEIDRASDMLNSGVPLGKVLPGRIGLELRTIVCGGRRIVEKLRAIDGDVFRHRPVLRPWDWVTMIFRATLAYP